ncbi:MAG: hypothetical protein EU542_04175 [Promethearchaeota archaeon]|nr:MAG: hypothetical protein EU542_04175 [Candidatus Lokiarchaeota archaeon]
MYMGKENYPTNPHQNPYRSGNNPGSNNPSSGIIDFNTQRICPACGKIIKIDHNFCKFCGVDLSAIEPIGASDEIAKQLAITAITDPDPEVRKEAVDTLGNFEDKRILGVLTYVLLNDPSDIVRKEACDEIGDLHKQISLNALTIALKDQSPIVRKEAIEGLKKIREKHKPKKEKKEKKEKEEKEKKEKEEKEETMEQLEQIAPSDEQDWFKDKDSKDEDKL